MRAALAAGALLLTVTPAHARMPPAEAIAPRAEFEPAAGQNPIPPFAAHYTADWKSINVGTSDIDLKPGTTPGSYVYTWRVTARGIFRLVYSNDVVQKSWFSVVNGHVRPEKYHAAQGDSTVDIDFDWEGGRAHGVSEKKPIELELAAATQDVMSMQIEAMLDVESGVLPAQFRILDKDAIKDFNYTLEGPARLRTALGELDTVVVASTRTGGNRVLRLWFAPALGYLPVQAQRFRDGKPEFTIRIKSVKR